MQDNNSLLHIYLNYLISLIWWNQESSIDQTASILHYARNSRWPSGTFW